MDKATALIVPVAGIAAIAVLSACSGSATSTQTLPGSSVSQSRALADLAGSGVSPKSLQYARTRAVASRSSVKPAAGGGELYVSDFGTNDVDVLKNNTWAYIAGIRNGINGPDGNWFAHGKFYVANYAGANINEYADYYNIWYTYSASMIDPVDVAVDRHGNVFEADYDYPYYNGFVNEYAQESNTVMATCAPGGGVEGVAVDKHGNVFIDYNNSSLAAGYIVEYTGGLAGCHGTTLPITLTFAGGMARRLQRDIRGVERRG
jgi:hypothetical protein